MQRLDAGQCHAGGEQRALDRVRHLASDHRFLDVPAERMKKVRRRRAVTRHRQVHLRRDDLACVGAQTGVVEVPDLRQNHRRAKAVEVLNEIGRRVGEVFARPLERDLAGVVSALNRQIVAARVGRDDKPPRVSVLRLGQAFPHFCAAQGVHSPDAHLAAQPTLRHALRRLERVDVVAVHPAVRHTDALLERDVVRHVDGGHAARHRQRRSGEERETKPLRVGDHLRAALPGRREMLVVEDRHRAAAVLKHFHDALEPLVARVERLAFLVSLVFSVLGDDDHAVDREFAGAQRQCRLNAGVERVPIALHAAAAEVTLRELVDVNRGDVQPRLLPLPAPAVAKREAVEEMLCMRVGAHLRAEKRNPLARRRRLAKGQTRNRSGGTSHPAAIPKKRTSSRLHGNKIKGTESSISQPLGSVLLPHLCIGIGKALP